MLNDDELAEKLGFLQFAIGPVSGPMDAWLTVRGIKTLAVRMERHSANAQAIADALVGHPAVERVYYPGLAGHPGHDLAARQMRGFGGMLSVALVGGPTVARALWPRDDEAASLRRRWDVALVRLRARLRAERIRPDLVHADGSGQVTLLLRDCDRVEDRT